MEHNLLTKLKAGDETVFKTIYNKYCPQVYNFTRLYITSLAETEEVVQEVFVKLWEDRQLLDTDKNLKGYLFIITRNLIFNKFRRSFNENNYKMSLIKKLNEVYEIEDDIEVNDLKQYIDTLIEELPPRQKEVYKLSREEYLKHFEIAQLLSISEKTVERHITEALRFLKKGIEQY